MINKKQKKVGKRPPLKLKSVFVDTDSDAVTDADTDINNHADSARSRLSWTEIDTPLSFHAWAELSR